MLNARERDTLHTQAKQNGDLIPYMIGHEQCRSGHSWGPGIRDYYLVHYVKQGVGIFRADGKEYALQAGQMFFIFPESISYYAADEQEPWEYFWVGFGGSRAAQFLSQVGITQQNPVFTCREQQQMAQCLQSMLLNYDNHPSHRLRFTGLMYTLISYLMDDSMGSINPSGSADQYYNRATEYIAQNYSHAMTVSELAGFIGIDRKYLYQIFKKTCSLSPEEYIIRFRMDRACELMGNEALPISTIAHSVGYGDPLLFSKMFKKNLGKSPSDYRKAKAVSESEYRPEDTCGRRI